MIAALLAGLVAGYAVAIPVGAIGSYLVSLTATASLRIGAAAALGVASADGLYAAIAVLGGDALASAIKPITTPLRLVSAAILVAIAIWMARSTLRRCRRTATHSNSNSDSDRDSVPTAGVTTVRRAYLGLAAITLVNPTTVLYFAALIAGNRATAASATADSASIGTVFVGAVLAASASWQLLLAGSGALLGHLLTSRSGQLLTGLASSLIIGILAARLIR